MAERVVITGQEPSRLSLELEATVTETHRSEVDITQHPIEVGADLTDHVRPLADGLEIVGIISNTPLSEFAGRPSVSGGDPNRRAESAFAELKRAHKSGTLCSITTTLATYENMALRSLEVGRDAVRGNIAELQMSWTELQFAETLKIELPEEVQRKKNLGKQGTKTAPESVKAPIEGILRSFVY